MIIQSISNSYARSVTLLMNIYFYEVDGNFNKFYYNTILCASVNLT